MHSVAGPNTYFGVGPTDRKEKKRKEKNDRMTAAVSHGHLNPSNEAPHFHQSYLKHFFLPESMRRCRSDSFVETGLLRN